MGKQIEDPNKDGQNGWMQSFVNFFRSQEMHYYYVSALRFVAPKILVRSSEKNVCGLLCRFHDDDHYVFQYNM